MNRRMATLVAAGLAGTLTLAACSDGSKSVGTGSKRTSTTAAPTLVTAPLSDRVDLGAPVFSNPTAITNPRFPIGALAQVLQMGEEAGAKLRFEVTLLPDTKTITVDGQQVETRVSQFVAYSDGRVLEVAVDFFAQADDGSVWYFGEDVANYVDGALDNTDGTWLAGKDGPPGMIMPADPKVGDVYRPENIPGFVFEEVTVQAVGITVEGPTGQVAGAIEIQELLMDGLLEDKTFAPGYGEFHFAVKAEKEIVDMALAVPIDARPGPVPAELTTLSASAGEIFTLAASKDWKAIGGAVDGLTAAADVFLAGDVPKILGTNLRDRIEALGTKVDARDAAATRQAAIDLGHAALDLQLQHRAPAEVDRERLELWNRQLELDEANGDDALVAGDRVIIETIQARIPS